MKSHYIDILKYNLWANQKIVQLIKMQPEEKFHKAMGNSFSSIEETMAHLWRAEFIWHKRLKGESIHPLPNLIGSIDKQIKMGLEISENFLHYIEASEDQFFESACIFYDSKNIKHSLPSYKILHHVMNHSTYHRGQIITMMRQQGVTEIQSTDYLTYINPA